MRNFYRALRIFASITLFFFCWTYLPIYAAVAWAAEPRMRNMERADRVGVKNGNMVALVQKPEERFEKALEEIRVNLDKAGEKSGRGEAATEEIEAIRKKKTEIESLDAELKKEFAATEKKLKDAKLPPEILDRHYKFVKHYEDNVAELRANLVGIEQGVKGKGFKETITKAKLHLEKTKPPKKHVPLDPNKLPFQNRKTKAAKAPRLKKEEFEKDFGPQRHQGTKTALSVGHELTRIFTNGFQKTAHKQKPILVAATGPLTGLLSGTKHSPQAWSFSEPSVNSVANDFNPQSEIRIPQWETQNSELNTENYLIAQAVDAPTADDLAETPEVQFTEAIRAKAEELGRNPVRIYEWVRNNIEYAPTYGSIQGADQCLQSKICNDTDSASLLIALLRISGIYAHYVYGTVDIPIEKAMNWVGGVTDPMMVGTILATNGVPVTLLKTSGNVYKYVRMEHVWVSAFIDYIPSRGAVHKQGDTWIPLDPSFKQYTYTQSIDIQSAVPFDAQSLANQIQSTATINPDGSVTNVNSPLIQQTMQDYQTEVQNYIQQNYPNATVGDVIGKKEIIQQNYPILLGTLPYKIVQVGSEFATVPDNLRGTMYFSIPDATGASAGLTYTIGMPQIAGKKITLSFSPATSNDQAVIESLMPAPHADGTPIQPSELPSSFPAYLINLVPELRIDGQIVTTGAPSIMGSQESFNMSLNEPSIGISNINNIIKSGEYFGIGVDTGRIGATRITTLKNKLELTKTKLATQNYGDITKEDIVGDFLYTTITSYFAQLDMDDEIGAVITGVIHYRTPSVGMYSLSLNVQEVFGIPKSAGSNGMMMDVDRIMQSVFSKDGSIDTVKQYMFSSGSVSSALEHEVPEQLYSLPANPVSGVSAVKALQLANDQGIPIYTINQANINTILPQLQIDVAAKDDIVNAVNAGKEVTVSKSNINVNSWLGCGYIVIDPTTGAGAYMISGGANGVWITMVAALIFLLAALAAVAFLAAGAATLILVAVLVFIGLMFVYGEMYFAFGRDRTNEFLGCLSIVGIIHYAVSRAAHYLPLAFEDYVERFMTVDGIHSFSECLTNLTRQ